MKVTVVPAQITTIEDRIAGSLGLSQLLLLTVPIFGGSALYIILPPVLHGAAYKFVIMTILAFTCSLLAIRIKGKILLLWLIVILRYNLRARYFVHDKNSLAAREEFKAVNHPEPKKAAKKPAKRRRLQPLATPDIARLQSILDNPAAHVAFQTNPKGGLRVLITEVKEQS